MIIIAGLYLALVYLIFFKWKVLPFNKISQAVVVVVGGCPSPKPCFA